MTATASIPKEVLNNPSPMMAQWISCKRQAKNAVLFFRLGDFYEAFYDDAEVMARELELTLTKRQEVPMAGVPYATVDTYIDRLVAKGICVAIAEQVEDPKKTKGIVKREIVRIVTPATVVNSSLISEKANNFFLSISEVAKSFGLAALDLTTGEFRVIECQTTKELADQILAHEPKELLVPERFKKAHSAWLSQFKLLVTAEPDWNFEHESAYSTLLEQLSVRSLEGFGVKGMNPAINAAGALIRYLRDSLTLSLDHIRALSPIAKSNAMVIDNATQRNLELVRPLNPDTPYTLLSVLDHTATPMGGRLLRSWVKTPLCHVEKIIERQDAVETLSGLDTLAPVLGQIRDLERITMKLSSGYATPRDLIALKLSLQAIPHLKSLLKTVQAPLIQRLEKALVSFDALAELLSASLNEEVPLRVGEGKTFRPGYNADLDELNNLRSSGKQWLATYQDGLKEQFGIRNLKVGYNRMFGYYIEVSKGQADRMPDTFQRRQTLVNAERFISKELKEYEEKVLTAQDRIAAIETELFAALIEQVKGASPGVFDAAKQIAEIDALTSLSLAARAEGFTRPVVDDSQTLTIEEGRHPVIEKYNLAERFVPNDTDLGQPSRRLMLITGPNMAGKSTYIRQVALITIMAQIGSFVPAQRAHIGLVDKVFTRIGASDDLARGQSTFMVEMTETAGILHNATNRSLVILDEIGRGTSTYDGISIAWSVAEYLLKTKGCQAKTLFATHYFELTELEEKIEGACNANVAVQETDQGIFFLRKIIDGAADKSYGIHVAELAGIPEAVIDRARQILVELEHSPQPERPIKQERQMSLFEVSRPVEEKLKNLRVNELTPLQALQQLADLQEMLAKQG